MQEEKLIIAFRKLKPHLMDIDFLVKEVKYGKLQLILTVRDSVVTDMEVVSKQLIRYDKGETVDKDLTPV